MHADGALDQRRVADLVAEAEERRGYLRVAQCLGVYGEAVREDREVTLRRVRDRLDLRVADEREHRGRVDRQRIDRRNGERIDAAAAVPADLHEAEVGYVAALGHELEVEREGTGGADAVRDGLYALGGGDEGALWRVSSAVCHR